MSRANSGGSSSEGSDPNSIGLLLSVGKASRVLPYENRNRLPNCPVVVLTNSEKFCVRVSVASVERIASPVKGMTELSSVKL